MKVLDLYSGLEGWSSVFRERGHDVTTLDYDPKFGADICEDVMTWDPSSIDRPDVVVASPDCTMFSTGGWHQHAWRMVEKDVDYRPTSLRSMRALDIVRRTVDLIKMWEPKAYVIENPRALLRKLGVIPFPEHEVWYCHYGENRAKPTSLWTNLDGFKRPCHNRRPGHRHNCCCRDHVAAPRGSVTGTQGMRADEAARIPYPLALSVCIQAEHI